jgi:dUTP pyrophosphatase
VILKVKKLHPEAKLPTYAHIGDAGMDIYAIEDTEVPPGEVVKVRSGLSMEIPEGYVGLCWTKSGLANNHKIKISSGVIDSGYRGEVLLGVINLGEDSYTFKKGDKVLQMLIQKVEHPEIIEAEELSESTRGTGGFGSTGK